MGSWYDTRKVKITRVFALHRVWECRTPKLSHPRLPVLQEMPLCRILAFCSSHWVAAGAEDSVAKCFEMCAIEAVGSVCQVNNLSHSEPHLDAYLLSDITSQRLLSTAGSETLHPSKEWALGNPSPPWNGKLAADQQSFPGGPVSIPGSGRYPGEENGNPLHYYC